jgi:hypothetical protein
MHPLHRLVIVLACLCCISCCTSSKYVAIGAKTFEPRPKEHIIDVYLPEEAPVQIREGVADPRPSYELPDRALEIGQIETSGASFASWREMIRDAQKRARALGGDAIVFRQWEDRSAGADSFGRASTLKTATLTVFRYEEIPGATAVVDP